MRLWAKKQKQGSCVFLTAAMVLLAAAFCLTNAHAASERVKFGVITSLKYPISKAQAYGAQLAVEEINAAGGINVGGKNYQIELIIAESNELSSVTDAVNAMERLLTVDKVVAVTGGLRGEAVLAMQEVMADNKVIFLGSASGTRKNTERIAENYDRYKYYFRNSFVNTAFMGAVQFALLDMNAAKVRKVLGIKKPKVALLVEKAMWAEPVIGAAKKLIPAMGMEVVGVWRPSSLAKDVTAELSAIKASGAHMIFTGITGPVGAVISPTWSKMRVPTTIGSLSTMSLMESFWKASGGTCEYEVGYDSYAVGAAITPKTIPFMKSYRKKFGTKPVFTSGSYDSVYIWKAAVEKAGTLDSDKLVPVLEKTDYVGTQGRVVFFPKGHKWPHDVIWGPGYVTTIGYQWIDGKQVCVWPDGNPLFPAISKDPGWKGLRYKGTHDIQLPPWMVEYWKKKK